MASILKVNELQHTGGTSAMTIDSSGRINKGVMPYIYLRGNNSSEVTSQGSIEVYTYWSLEGVALGGMTWNSGNGRITVPVDGMYLVAAKFYLWIDNTTNHGVMARKNGTTFQEYQTDFSGVGAGGRTDHTVTISEILKLDAGDYIDFQCNADVYGGANHTNCQMVMLG